jgi:hypothetical protein
MKREAFMNRIKMVATLIIIPLILSLVGCKPMLVLNSLFSESEWLFEPQLLGDWIKIDPEKQSFCSFHVFDPQEIKYKVDFDSQDEYGWIGKIGDNYYLDIESVEQNNLPNKGQGELDIIPTAQGYQVKPAKVMVSEQIYLDFLTDQPEQVLSGQSGKIKFKARPLHKIYRVRLENDQLTIWYLDDEKFAKQIETGMIKLAHQKEPFSLITADRLELQEFLKTYGESEALFSELGTYGRVVDQGIIDTLDISNPVP